MLNNFMRRFQKIKNREQGFTLIESILAIFVVIVGVLGVVALIQRTVAFTSLTSGKLIAAYLAQEGIEIVRNIRDTNWLTGNEWNEGLTDCSLGCEGDYNDSALSPYQGFFLKIDQGGFYNYELGQETSYRRKIIIFQPANDILEVLVEVEWQERGRIHRLAAQENLYNWYYQ